MGKLPHEDGDFGHRKLTLFNALPSVNLCENDTLLLLFRRLKTKLFENFYVIASIHFLSDYALGTLGITRGYFICLSSNCKGHNFFRVDGNFFENVHCVDANLFLRPKMLRFLKYLDKYGHGLR